MDFRACVICVSTPRITTFPCVYIIFSIFYFLFSFIFSCGAYSQLLLITAFVPTHLSREQLIHGYPQHTSLYSTTQPLLQFPPKSILFLSSALILILPHKSSYFFLGCCIVCQFLCSGLGAKGPAGMRGGPAPSFHLSALIELLLLLLCEFF